MIPTLLFIVVCLLAYSNGANDNFKGVATLLGSGTTDYRRAIVWATVTTLLGSVAAMFLAGELVKNFSGKGLVPDEMIRAPEFAASIALGAGLTVLLATRIGMPISTTHSLVGALFGTGVVTVGSAFNFSRLASVFLVPLIVSPLLAAGGSALAYLIFRKMRLACGVSKETCVCVGKEYLPVLEPLHVDRAIAMPVADRVTVKLAKEEDCVEIYQGRVFGVGAQKLLDSAHYLSAGVVSFARGLNDTPKIVGLLLAISALDMKWGMIAVAVAMAVGGLLNARRVGETVALTITPMNPGQGFTANLITGLLVTTASVHGMPVSTTHVSVGCIFGIGTVTRKADVKVIRNILMSWMLTLPVAAICSATVYSLLVRFS